MLESELSFLIRRLPDLRAAVKKEIEQYYLSAGPEALRLRQIGDRYELTKKLDITPGDFSRKEELTIPLTRGEFLDLKPLARRGLVKIRHYLALPGGFMAEVDVFHGALEGLAMVEVEFKDEKSRTAFQPPDWFGRDVSQEEWSTNSWLAGKTLADVKPHIDREA